ncbi:putative Ig domain-containing protein [Nostoc punctiforme]|nr:putative Ig domain-containing protein [Nostoc punctiforme]
MFGSTPPSFQLNFNTPQVAIGFYVTDIGDGGGQLNLTLVNGATKQIQIPHKIDNNISGSKFYFGYIDVANPFTKVTFSASTSNDGYGIDDITVADAEQIKLLTDVPVIVRTADGRGGVADQSFKIHVQPEPGNHAPMIITDPVTQTYNSVSYIYNVKALDPDNDSLTYSLVKAPNSMTIDANTGMISWSTPVAGQQDVTVRVQDSRGGIDTQSFKLDVSGASLGQVTGKVYIDDGKPKNQLVYFEDFENQSKSLIEWSNSRIDTTPIGNRHFLGQYGGIVESTTNRQTSLSLNNLGIHDSVTVDFDLYLLNSWDGNLQAFYSPDRWKLQVRGGQTLLDTTFMNSYLSNRQTLSQSYPDNYFASGTILNPAFTGATEVETLGYNLYGGWRDSVYHLQYTFEHTDSNLILDFIGGTDEVISNESWGIDNVKVSVGLPKQGIVGAQVYLDNNHNGKLDTGETSTLTDSNGKYSFNLPTGDYTVAQLLQTGLIASQPTTGNYNVTVRRDQSVSGLDFANIIDSSLAQVSPEFLSTPLLTATIERKYRYQAVAKDDNFDPLTYDLVVKPDGMVIDSKTGVVTWLPAATHLGKTNAVIRVSDGKGGVALQAFSIDVAQPNLAPGFINNIPGFTSTTTLPEIVKVAAGDTYRFQFNALDPDSDPISYRIKSFNSQTSNNINTLGVSIDGNTGLFSWNTAGQDLGFYSATVGVIDTKGAENIQTFTLELTNSITPAVNLAPVIVSTAPTNISLGQFYLYAVQASDSNYDPLTYSLEYAPLGMTIDSSGKISWQPQANQLGSQHVTLNVSDDRGGIATQSFDINIVSSVNHINHAPSITSAPNLITNLDRVYEYNLSGSDPDGDLLLWSLDAAPEGMVIDAQRGTLRWQPSSTQIGEHTVAVQLTDAYGMYAAQEFTLTVTGANTPSQIVSTPITRAALNQQYTYTVVANDPENDRLTFSLGRKPAGMSIDTNGTVRWTPQATQVGQQQVEVLVTDEQGAVTSQIYTIEVGTTAINTAPSIVSTPVYLANVGSAYQYQVQATDPDAGDRLTYQLLSVPAGVTGISIDSTTGLLTWANPVAGNYKIVVSAVDASGLGAAQGFTLTARVNNAPVIRSNPVLTATPGSAYAYDLIASDLDGDRLTYTLDQASLNKGITLDALGRLRWNPTVSNIGTHRIVLTVSDGITSTPQQYELVVAADTEAPKVKLIANYDTVDLGQTIIFQARATDNVKMAGLQLLINGNAVVLDANGMARYTTTEAGTIFAKAIAKDTAGNVGQATFDVAVIDSNDLNAPEVSLNLGAIAGGLVTAPVDIRGSISDDGQLDYYRLLVAPVAGGEFREIAFVDNPNVIANGVLGRFDPSLLQNDSYILRLEVADNGGHVSYAEEVVDVAGELKLGNFRLSFTDLTVPVTGVPITLTRTYDSLNSGSTDDFGYGWRMEFRDTDLRTSLKRDPDMEELGYHSAFKEGTRVYITLPGGKREAFTFKPKMVQKYDGVYLGQFAQYFYQPKFVADKGGTSTLTVESNFITKGQDTDQFFGMSGNAYNPEDPYFGGKYKLTTKEGVVYEIDAATGDLLTVTDTNGNKLTYTDAGIYSSTGKQVTFERDAQGRIASVKDPMGELVRYEYNAKGDLVSVTDQEKFKTQFVYDQERSHYLKEIIDPLNRAGAKVEYGDDGRLKKTLNATGNSVEIDYDPVNSLQTVKDALGNPTTYEYDTRGNVVRVVDPLGHQTQMKYDDENNLLQVTDANNLVTKYEYDDKGNLKSRTEEYCGCPTVVPGTSYYTYDKYGNMTSLVTPTGASMTMDYDRFGNMLSMKDGLGNVIQSFTYDVFGQVKTETDSTGTTTYQYDDFGNVIKIIDADGSATTMEYYGDGKLKRMVEDNGTPNDTSDDEISTFEYDKLGREKFADYGDGIWVKYDYEGAGGDWTKLEAPTIGKIERKLTADGKLAGWVTADGGTPTFKYDLVGRLWRETDTNGNDITEYGYDAAGRLTTVKDLRTGATTTKKYDAGGRTTEEIDVLNVFTRYFYDPKSGKLTSTERGKYIKDTSGQLVEDTTVQKQVYRYEYNGLQTTVIDPLNRRTTSVMNDYYLPTETIYTTGQKEKISYLYANNLQEAKDYPTKIVDIGGNDRDFTYDELGRLKTATDLGNSKYTYDYGNDGLGKITSPTGETLQYGYDDLGNLAKVTYGDSTFKQMTYSTTDNRLETVTLPNGEIITYQYNDAGQVTSQTSSTTGAVSFTYTEEGAVKTMTDSTGTTTYRYDSNDRLEGMDYANGSSISYTYDIVGRIKTLTEKGSANAVAYTTEYDYDAFGNLSWVKDPAGGITTMKYDVVNRFQERILPNGVKTTYDYDDLDRVKSIVHTNAQGQVLASVSYERQGVGEPSKITREDGSYTRLEYDEALRVKKESNYNLAGGLLNETSYTYDASGKRQVQSSTNNSRTFTYTPGYQLDTIHETGETENYDYDENGRLTLIERDGKTLDLNHDAYDRLTTVENETTGETTQYIYDGSGNRVKEIQGNQERRFLVAPAMGGGLQSKDLITDGSGNLISNYIYGGGSSPFMRLDANGNAVYYLTDAMGSVIGLADGNGASSGKFLYDAFGNILNGSSLDATAGGDFRFQGQWLESESGLYHFRARDYDAATGLFLSRDPVDIIETVPQSFNPYQFVYNNPYIYSDPTGMFSMAELNTTITIQDILQQIRATAMNQAREYATEQARGIVGNLITSALNRLLPFSSEIGFADQAPGGHNGSPGLEFEKYLRRAVCGVLGELYPNALWLGVDVERNGEPLNNGFNCGNLNNLENTKIGGNISSLDFIFKQGGPQDTDKKPPAYVSGDMKISVQAAYDRAKRGNRGKEKQWDAMVGYAKYHQFVPVAVYATFYGGPEGRIKSIKKYGAKNGIILETISILPNIAFSKK